MTSLPVTEPQAYRGNTQLDMGALAVDLRESTHWIALVWLKRGLGKKHWWRPANLQGRTLTGGKLPGDNP